MSYLTQEEVQEFKKLVKEIKGINLTDNEALEQGTRLIMLFEQMQRFEPVLLSYKDAVEKMPASGKKK